MNTVVLYDRAGLGSSEPAPSGKPRTSKDVARDLHALLTKSKVPGPYVLVGHSIGGLHVRAFADQYPNDVAGVVLVDATHPDQEAKWLAALPRETKGEPEAVTKGRQFIRMRLAEKGDRNPEHLDLVQSRQQVRAAKPLGDKPLAVLTHAKGWKMEQSLPDDVSARLERVTQELQAGTTKLSSDSSHTVAKKAGHGIHVDEPELVITAIREVAGKVNGMTKRE